MNKLASLLLCFTALPACVGTQTVDSPETPLAEITDARFVLRAEPQKLVLDIVAPSCPRIENRAQAMLDNIRANTFERGGHNITDYEVDQSTDSCGGAFAEWWISALPATETSTITISDTETSWTITFSRDGKVLACTAPGGCAITSLP